MRRLTVSMWAAWCLVVMSGHRSVAAEKVDSIVSMPTPVRAVIENHCLDCHDVDVAEGGLGIAPDAIDWSTAESIEAWELVHTMLTRRIMPPADMEPLSDSEVRVAAEWISDQLMRRSPVGGTAMRRLSRREYRNTIRSVFELPRFELPAGFPEDNRSHGFDNQADALVISPSHMEAFSQTAVAVADEFFPPARPPIPSRRVEIPADDLTISYSSACLYPPDGDGSSRPSQMRLASSGTNVKRNATWPARFEAPAHGKYRIQIQATSVIRQTDGSTNLFVDIPVPELEINRQGTGSVSAKKPLLGRFVVPSGETTSIELEATLDRGQTISMRYASGPFDYEDNKALTAFLERLFEAQPELAAAWDAVGQPARGGSGWDQITQQLLDPNRASKPMSDRDLKSLIQRLVRKKVDTGETLVFKFFDEGPFVAIEHVTIEGPIETYPDSDDLRRQRQRQAWLGSDFKGPDSLPTFVSDWLSRLYRRPPSEMEVQACVDRITEEAERTGSLDAGLHLAIRMEMLSPSFLFRSIGDTDSDASSTGGIGGYRLSDLQLASRLSYFLTSDAPDPRLRKLAESNQLSDPAILAEQTKRLIGERFAHDFVYQWLGLRSLESLMPDTRLMPGFTNDHRDAMIQEAVQTFSQLLQANAPAIDLIAPDFVFTNALVGRDIYGLNEAFPDARTKKNRKRIDLSLQRVVVEQDSYRGGLLCMPAVMMATANGVDTQPVLRGVWVLENLLGAPPPEPPGAVPALTPDTQGASTPKQRLAAHMADASCATCHREIDPIGFALETFDPIGRWRDHYPVFQERRGRVEVIDGPAVDASGVLPSGEPLADVRTLKRWLVDHPRPFVRCLSEKWMTYATGRALNYRERQMIAEIVDAHAEDDYPLVDLLTALVDSAVFRTR